MRETCVWSLGWEDLLEKGKATHPSVLAWRIPSIIYSPWSCKESEMTEPLCLLFLKITITVTINFFFMVHRVCCPSLDQWGSLCLPPPAWLLFQETMLARLFCRGCGLPSPSTGLHLPVLLWSPGVFSWSELSSRYPEYTHIFMDMPGKSKRTLRNFPSSIFKIF